MRKVLGIALLAISMSYVATGASLKLDATVYVPGTPVTVQFTAPSGLSDQAWIGLIPSNIPHGDEAVNDANDVDYQYLGGKTSGSITLTAPSKPGAWDARLNDGAGKEIASVSFTVKPVDASGASLTLAAKTAAPGAPMTVTYKAPAGMPKDAWIGVVPATIPHGDGATIDQYDVDYTYLEGKTSGSWSFTAPGKTGAWNVRMIDAGSHGREISSVSFEVQRVDASAASLRLDRTTVPVGQEFTVHFTAPSGLPENAWVGIIPSNVPHGDEETNDQHDVDYQYLKGRTGGTLTFRAPAQAGAYDLRMNDTDSNGKEIASTSFTVGGELSSKEMAATLASSGKLAIYGIHFATDSASIEPDSKRPLAEIGQLLIRDPGLRLAIVGHTDSTGEAAHNQELSQRRAESVKSYLVETFGIDAARLTTRGMGADQPVATNDTEAGRALNRRVELVRQ